MTAPIIAVVGGGQLARMMAPAATALGITLRVLVEAPDSSAAFAAHQTVVGVPSDESAIAALLAEPRPNVVTWEHEHIPAAVFAAAEQRGVAARPALSALLYAQDKIQMRTRMDQLGLPNPAWAAVSSLEEVEAFLAAHGDAVLKTARGGYDGKGVKVISKAHEAAEWIEAAHRGGPALLVEKKVPFSRELAVLVARRPSGEIALWATVHSNQQNGVCFEVIAPAPDLKPEIAARAEQIARTIATDLDVTGVLAVELFEVDGDVLINELAMRPHNSGHWTINGSVTSQFEQHLRAVLDLPLGDTASVAPWTVMVNILGGASADLTAALPVLSDGAVKVNLYGKDVKPGRKVGHVNVSGSQLDDVRQRAAAGAALIREGNQS